MKTVLILAYDFPPYVSVGGFRPYSWYKYFKEYNVHPIVVTRQWDNKFGNHLDYISASNSNDIVIEDSEFGRIIRTPYKPNLANKIMLKYGESKYKFIRKAVSAFYEFGQFVFSIGPKVSIYKAANEYLKDNRVDVILASGEPFILFKYASKLSSKYDIPWIADYRDFWSQTIDIQKNVFLKTFYTFFEKKAIKSASRVLTVSAFLQNKISLNLPNKKFIVLQNGYDPEVMVGLNEITQGGEVLNISHIGTNYEWYPVESVLSVFSAFMNDFPSAKICVKFYGANNQEWIKKIISVKYPNIQKHVSFFLKVPNVVLLRELAKDNVMLLFNNYSYMGTKIYDYLGIKRQILFCYVDDENSNELKKKFYDVEEMEQFSGCLQGDLILETNSGILAKDSKHLYSIFDELYSEFMKSGKINCNSINTENYSRKNQVEELAAIVNEVARK